MRKTGEILEEYMSNKMSQRDLAAIIDVTPQYINNIVKGIKRPSPSFLSKFYKIFEVSIEDKISIDEYEEFRRLPEKTQEGILILKNKNEQLEKQGNINNIEIKIYGTIEKNGYFRKSTNIEKINFFKLAGQSENYFCVINYYSDYKNNQIQSEDIMIFEKRKEINANIITGEKNIYIVKFEEEVKICKLEDTGDYILVKDLNMSSKTVVLGKNDRYKLKIIGKLEKNIRSY